MTTVRRVELSEPNEPSYYEIALTNRQVLVSFVVLLSCVLEAFVSGVWLGRKSNGAMPSGEEQLASAEALPADLEQLEEFKFPSEQQEASAPAQATAESVVVEPKPRTTLAEDVGSSPPQATPPPPRPSPPPPRPSPPPPRPAPPPPSPAPPPPRATPPPPAAAPPAAVTEGFIIQVLSTRDEARAKRVLGQLKQGGYPAFLSPVKVGRDD